MDEFNGAIGIAPDEPLWSSLFTALFRGPIDRCYGGVQVAAPSSATWSRMSPNNLMNADIGACTDLALCAIVTGAIPTFVSFLVECLQDAPLHAAWASSRECKQPSRSAPRHFPEFALKVLTLNCRSLLEQGKLVFVADRLKTLEVDIACIQETRLRDKLDIEAVGEYKICSSAAEPHRGGLMILYQTRPGITLIEHCSTSTRVLRATFRINGRKLHVLAAHAPTEEDSPHAHSLFSIHVQQALGKLPSNELVVLGCDMNAKVQGLDLKMVGENAISRCRYSAAHRLPLLTALDAKGFRMVNTFLGSDADVTWRHPNGSLSQIDFIIADSSLTDMASSAKAEEWGIFDLATASDHCAVSAIFNFGARQRPTKQASLPRFANDAHYAEFADRCKHAPFAAWDGLQDPAVFISELVRSIAKDIVVTKPKKVPRKPWISSRTWNLMFVLNRYRRLLSALLQDDHPRAALIAQEIISHEGENFFPQDEQIAGPVDGCHVAIRVLGTVTKRMLREDRRRWIDQNCANIHELKERNDMRGFHREIKRLSKSRGKRAGQTLLDAHGVAVTDKTVVGDIWMDHWKNHFDAMEIDAVSFEDRATILFDDDSTDLRALPAYSGDDDDLHIPSTESETTDVIKFTAQDVKNAIARMPARKATPDLIPSECWKLVADQSAPALAAMFNRYICHRCVPHSFAGSRVVSVWKKKGSVLCTKSYRPIALMKTEAKLMARLLLAQLTSRLKHHAAQFGSGHSAGTLCPQVIVRQLAAAAHSAELASATLFVDICAAFDKVLKPLLWGTNAAYATAENFERMGHTGEQSQMIFEFLATHPSILSMCGLPVSLISVLRVWGANAWFCTQADPTGCPSRACRTTSGVRQGDNISAIIFDIFYGVVVDELVRELRTSNLLVSLPCPIGRTFRVVARHGQQPHDIELGPVAYRDDLALSLWGSTNQELLEKIIRASSIVQRVHSLFHLTVNFAATKTEVAIALRRPDAKSHWLGMRLVGQARGSKRPMIALSDGLSLTVASTYPHLGCIHAQSLDLKGEVSQMLTRARSALADKKTVVANRRLTRKSRLGVHCTYIRGHLLQNVAVLQPFPAGLAAKLEAEYCKGLRVCTDQVVAFAGDHKMTTSAIMLQYDIPRLSVLMERRTLGGLFRLLVSDNLLVMAALSADASSRSCWKRIFSALNNLRAAKPGLLGHLPHAEMNTMDPWIEFIIHHDREWPAILKSYRGVQADRVEHDGNDANGSESDRALHPEAAVLHAEAD
eukprot:11051-Amphidinium_carterae.1